MPGEPEDRRDSNEITKAPLPTADEDTIIVSLVSAAGKRAMHLVKGINYVRQSAADSNSVMAISSRSPCCNCRGWRNCDYRHH